MAMAMAMPMAMLFNGRTLIFTFSGTEDLVRIAEHERLQSLFKLTAHPQPTIYTHRVVYIQGLI